LLYTSDKNGDELLMIKAAEPTIISGKELKSKKKLDKP